MADWGTRHSFELVKTVSQMGLTEVVREAPIAQLWAPQSSQNGFPTALATPSRPHGHSRFKMAVAALQQARVVDPLAGQGWLFAYNGLPAIAVAKDCWFGARQFSTCPFFMPGRFNSIL